MVKSFKEISKFYIKNIESLFDDGYNMLVKMLQECGGEISISKNIVDSPGFEWGDGYLRIVDFPDDKTGENIRIGIISIYLKELEIGDYIYVAGIDEYNRAHDILLLKYNILDIFLFITDYSEYADNSKEV